jgi:hypothetical protein
MECANFGRVGRIPGVNHQSVVDRVNAYRASPPAARRPAAAPETLEMDEPFTFVGSKKGDYLLDSR